MMRLFVDPPLDRPDPHQPDCKAILDERSPRQPEGDRPRGLRASRDLFRATSRIAMAPSPVTAVKVADVRDARLGHWPIISAVVADRAPHVLSPDYV